MTQNKILLNLFYGTILGLMVFQSSCNFITSPDPYVNENAIPMGGGIKVVDRSTGEICAYYGKKIIDGKPMLDLVPDSSSNRIVIDSIQIDLTFLTTFDAPSWPFLRQWYYYQDGYNCLVQTQAQTVTIIPVSGISGKFGGMHRFRFFVRMYSINSGLELLVRETRVVEIVLNLINT